MSLRSSNSHEIYSRESIPGAVSNLLEKGYLPTKYLFNIALPIDDGIERYDLIDPSTEDRVLWTPKSEGEIENLIQNAVGDEGHPVFFPVISKDEQGNLRAVPASVRSLTTMLEGSPYVPAYGNALVERAGLFLERIHDAQPNIIGLTLEKLAINHNGDMLDDVFFTIVSPIKLKSKELVLGDLALKLSEDPTMHKSDNYNNAKNSSFDKLVELSKKANHEASK